MRTILQLAIACVLAAGLCSVGSAADRLIRLVVPYDVRDSDIDRLLDSARRAAAGVGA